MTPAQIRFAKDAFRDGYTYAQIHDLMMEKFGSAMSTSKLKLIREGQDPTIPKYRQPVKEKGMDSAERDAFLAKWDRDGNMALWVRFVERRLYDT